MRLLSLPSDSSDYQGGLFDKLVCLNLCSRVHMLLAESRHYMIFQIKMFQYFRKKYDKRIRDILKTIRSLSVCFHEKLNIECLDFTNGIQDKIIDNKMSHKP